MAEIDFNLKQQNVQATQGAEMNISLLQDDGTGVVRNNILDATVASLAIAQAGTDTRPRHWSAKRIADIAVGASGVQSIANMTALRITPVTVGKLVYLQNHTLNGGGGFFEGIAAGATPFVDDNGITVVVALNAWVRVDAGNKWELTWFGTAHNLTSDDTAIWKSTIDALSLAGGGVLKVGAPQSFIDGHVRVKSNVHLKVDGKITYGANGRISITGSPAEVAGASTTLAVAGVAAASTITVANAAAFAVGDVVKIRGNRDTGSTASTVEQHLITAIALNVITFAHPLKSAFPLTWATSPWALAGNVDTTRLAKLSKIDLTVAALRGDDAITVASTVGLAVNQTILLSDFTMGSSNPNNPSNNYLYQEMITIAGIAGNVLSLMNKLHHPYSLLNKAHLLPSLNADNAKVTGATVNYNALSSTQKHAFEISFARNSSIIDCHVEGDLLTGFGNVGHGFRVDVGLNNVVDRCSVKSPTLTGPAEGYGFSLYGSTGCKLTNSFAMGCRHSFILFKGAAGNLVSNNTSYGCMNSDYDLHGSNEVDNVIEDNIGIGTTRITVDSSSHGLIRIGNSYHVFGAHRNTIRNNTGYNLQGNFIDLQVASKDNVIENNNANTCKTGIRLSVPGSVKNGGKPYDSAAVASGNTIRYNTIKNCERGMDINGKSTDAVTLVVTKNIYDNDISHNTIDGATGVAVYGQDAVRNDLSHTTITNSKQNVALANSAYAMRLIRCNDTRGDGIRLLKTVAGIYLSGGSTNFHADGVLFDGLTGTVATDYTFRGGGGDGGLQLTNHIVRGFVPKWSISNAATPAKLVTDGAVGSGISPAQATAIIANTAKVSDINHVAALLPNANNTSDLAKPISTLTQTALNAKLATTQKAAVNGLASLNAASEVVQAQAGASAQVTAGLGASSKRANGTWSKKAVWLGVNYPLQTFADMLIVGVLYAINLNVPQNGLPTGFWYVEVLRHSGDYAANRWRVIRCTSFGASNMPNLVYQSTCANGVWTPFIKTVMNKTLVWTTPTLVNGWVDFGGVHAIKYTKDDNGTVFMRGLVTGGSNTTNTIIFTLPVGYRPALTVLCAGAIAGGMGRFDIVSNGVLAFVGVDLHTGNAIGFLSLATSFKAA